MRISNVSAKLCVLLFTVSVGCLVVFYLDSIISVLLEKSELLVLAVGEV